jgi:ribose transport system permease protein
MSNPSAAPALDHTQAQVRDARNSWLAPLRQQLVFSQARAMTIVAILLIVLFSRTAPSFFSASNFIVIGATSSYVAIVAVGLTVLFIVGEFDLSLGAIYGVSGTLIALMSIKWGLSPVVALLFGLLLSAGVGLINGAFTTLGRVPSFIVTIGMLSVLEGLSQFISGGQPMTLPSAVRASGLAAIFQSRAFGLPAPLFLAALVFVGTEFLLGRTLLGAHIYLTGGNPRAARQVGINVTRIKTFCFMFAGLLAGLSGASQVFQLGTAQPGTGGGDFLFQAVGAAIIGGVALTGGEGSMYGTLVGAVILGVLTNGLALSGVDPGIGVLLTGALIIIAGVLNSGMREALAVLMTRARVRRHQREAQMQQPLQPRGVH